MADPKPQLVTAVMLFRVRREAADAWRTSRSDVTEARCRVARDDYWRATRADAQSKSVKGGDHAQS